MSIGMTGRFLFFTRGYSPTNQSFFYYGEHTMKKHISLTSTLVATALLATPALADSIKVGSLAAVTGPIPDLVAPINAARIAAAKLINTQGGLSGGKLELVSYDSKCDGKSAVDAATKAINVDQVVAIVGPTCSGASIAAINSVTVPAGITNLSDTASAPTYTDLDDNDLAFRAAPSDAYQGVALAKAILGEGVKKVAVTYANDDYNIGISKVFTKAFKDHGGTITASQMHEPKKASYRSELSTLAKSEADTLVIFSYYGSGGITILRNSLENGFFEKFYGGESMVEDKIIEQIGFDNLKGIYKGTTPASDTTSTAYGHYTELGIANADGVFVANGFDSVFLMALAVEKAGGDRTKVSAALRSVASAPGEVIYPGEWAKAKALIAAGKDINYEGASGNLDFDKNGDVSGIYAWKEPTASFKSVKLLK